FGCLIWLARFRISRMQMQYGSAGGSCLQGLLDDLIRRYRKMLRHGRRVNRTGNCTRDYGFSCLGHRIAPKPTPRGPLACASEQLFTILRRCQSSLGGLFLCTIARLVKTGERIDGTERHPLGAEGRQVDGRRCVRPQEQKAPRADVPRGQGADDTERSDALFRGTWLCRRYA